MDRNLYDRLIRLCKVLLKQNRISEDYRKQAISLLGPFSEQRKCFVEYEMHVELATLYESHDMQKELYDLLLGTGQLEKALEVAVVQRLCPDSLDEESVTDDNRDLSWATVLKRTFEAYIRGERPNMYGEWLQW